MSEPLERNRLGEEPSPYLQDHADNPVNWQPWDLEALSGAKKTNRPIFLSIGYAACHWCHVMADESFEDEAVADILNDRYVPIKVDREERPDVDRIYQTIAGMITGQGGWPLSVWLTPSREPFYIGTYFPREASHGRPGFIEILSGLADKWENEHEDIQNRARDWTNALSNEFGSPPETTQPLDPSSAAATTVNNYIELHDDNHGGFTTDGPKFPQPERLRFLLRNREGASGVDPVLRTTLDAMASGGLFDHVGGGFHRYATDRTWTVPHFEKMLYDNAQLLSLYTEATIAFDDDRYRSIAERTLEFLQREMAADGGGYYASLDAQSDGKEGTYYVWTPEEVHTALDDSDLASMVCERFGITEAGNFEGSTVLTIDTAMNDLDESANPIQSSLAMARTRLQEWRQHHRSRPARDEKILAGWNGLVVSALAGYARIQPESSSLNALDLARATLEAIRDRLWDGQTLKRRYKDGNAGIPGFLDDYAYLARGALDVHATAGDEDELAFALDLGRELIDRFWDPEEEILYLADESAKDLPVRPQESADRSTPSPVGMAYGVIQELAHLDPNDEFGHIASAITDSYGPKITSEGIQHPTLVRYANRTPDSFYELTIVDTEQADRPGWWDELAPVTFEDPLISWRPKDDAHLAKRLESLHIDSIPPIWKGREGRGSEPTFYACRGQTCSQPLTDPTAVLEY